MSVNNTCAISSSISFLISAAIGFTWKRPSQGYSQAGCRESRAKLPEKIAAHQKRRLAHLHAIRLFFPSHIVPVVQRIEQGFPNAKTAFLQESPNDIRSTQF